MLPMFVSATRKSNDVVRCLVELILKKTSDHIIIISILAALILILKHELIFASHDHMSRKTHLCERLIYKHLDFRTVILRVKSLKAFFQRRDSFEVGILRDFGPKIDKLIPHGLRIARSNKTNNENA